jgi:hypothetical protein
MFCEALKYIWWRGADLNRSPAVKSELPPYIESRNTHMPYGMVGVALRSSPRTHVNCNIS